MYYDVSLYVYCKPIASIAHVLYTDTQAFIHRHRSLLYERQMQWTGCKIKIVTKQMFVRAKLTAVGIASLMSCSCRPKRETSVTWQPYVVPNCADKVFKITTAIDILVAQSQQSLCSPYTAPTDVTARSHGMLCVNISGMRNLGGTLLTSQVSHNVLSTSPHGRHLPRGVLWLLTKYQKNVSTGQSPAGRIQY